MSLLPNVAQGPWPNGTTLEFFLTTTLTKAIIYEDDTLNPFGTLANPQTVGSSGYTSGIFYDPTVKYRLQITPPGFSEPLLDLDPVNEFLSITGADLAAGAVVENLGYTPANVDGQVFTGNTGANFTPTEINNTDFGYRLLRRNIQDDNYQLALDDSNNMLVKDDTGTGDVWTIEPHATTPYPPGWWCDIEILNTGTVALTRGAGVTLRLAGSGTSQDVTLAEWASGRLKCVAQDEWVYEGVGGS